MENIAPHSTEPTQFDTIACPACGLLCDDISIQTSSENKIKVIKNGCAKSIQFFERPQINATAYLAGKPSEIQSAISRIAELLSHAEHPVIAGLATEVQGMRAVMSLADKVGASLDHMNSNASLRNTLVVQNSGWQTCTLTEVRNRVDLLVIIGTDIVSQFPRFFERVVWNSDSMFEQNTASREIVYLGGKNLDTSAGVSPDGRLPSVLACDQDKLPEVTAALRALVSGKSLQATEVAGIPISDLANLAERLKAAKYSVIAWSAATLNFPHAELTVQNIAETVVLLNKNTRSAGLPLGGNDGDITANQVSTWISGYPMRNSFIKGYPEYSPLQFSVDTLLDNHEADVLIWVNPLSPNRQVPTSSIPTIVLGYLEPEEMSKVDVYIPLATPGIDHRGVMFRGDSVVSLPLAQLRNSLLPSLQSVLSSIESALVLSSVDKEQASC